MATTYAGSVRNGSMAAARLHLKLGTREVLEKRGGNVDVFAAILATGVTLLVRPLNSLLGAYLPPPLEGILITTERPLPIQRFTAAHELGHHCLGHLPSLDDESIIRRMAISNPTEAAGPNMQEVEADAFAAAFLIPRWLVDWHCRRQGWRAADLATPLNVYQLSLRLGTSYAALTWTLQRMGVITGSIGASLRRTTPRDLKVGLLRAYKPSDYHGDVWLLTERDGATRISGSRNDHFVLRLTENCGAGYLWNIDQLKESGFAIVSDDADATDADGVGGAAVRSVTAVPEDASKGELSITEARPWEPDEPISELRLTYDLTGPAELGYSAPELRQQLAAA